MTRKEAKGNLIHAFRWNDMPKKEAIDIAIKALEQEPCEDCISRQAVWDVMQELWGTSGELLDRLMALPPVTPQSSGDLISRQSAIFLASDLKQDLPDDERITDMVMAHNEGILEYQTRLSLLPSVTLQPKTGHWIPCQSGVLRICSECKNFGDLSDAYCKHCGAKMFDPQEREG